MGVAPPGFEGSSAGWAPDIFVPARAVFSEADLARKKTDHEQLDLIGRVEPGRTLAEAQAEMTVLSRRLEQADPTTNRNAGVLVSRLRGFDPEARSSEARLPTLLIATVACLLMIACVNLAGLLQTRHATRGKGDRDPAGARRRPRPRGASAADGEPPPLRAGRRRRPPRRMVGHDAAERAYAREMLAGTRHFYPLTLDARAFLLALLTAAATGVIFGLVPALQASRPVLVPALKEETSAPRRSRARAAFLVVQVALSLVLVIGAALAVQSARTVLQDPGFDAGHIAYFNVSPSRAGYRGEKAMRYASDVRHRLESLPFVESLSYSWVPPPFWFATAHIALPGQDPARREDRLRVPVNWVSARFFETLHIPVIQGRGIEPRDIDQGRPVVVVNEALARRLWPEQDPVGRRLMADGSPFEVVGIVRYEGLRAGGETAHPYLFFSDTGKRQQGSLLVRVKGDAVAALPSLRREILAAAADVPINQAMSLTSVIANQHADVPIAMGVLSFAGGLALLLTTLGLYGLVTLWVGQREREIGIRMALGSTSARIVTLVLREGLRLVVIGLPLGLAVALAAGRLLSSYLYEVWSTDAGTFSVITALLAGVALFACYVPARHATRVDPVQALRHD